MNYCKNCGTKLEDNQKFCPKCGIALDIDESVNVHQNPIPSPSKSSVTPMINSKDKKEVSFIDSLKRKIFWIGIYIIVLILELAIVTTLSRHIHYPPLVVEVLLSIAGLIFPGWIANTVLKKKN